MRRKPTFMVPEGDTLS
jgi:calmodulin